MKLNKYIVFLIGKIIFSIGISLGNRSLFGGNSMAVLVTGISKNLPALSYGTCNLMIGIIEVIIGYICDRSNVTLVAILALVFGSYMIDFVNLFILPTSDIFIRIIFMLIGILCYCLGLAIEQHASVGYSNYDVFVFGIKKAIKADKYHTAKWIVDIVFIIIGFMLGAEVGVGTLSLLLFTGIIVEKFRELLKKVVKVND